MHAPAWERRGREIVHPARRRLARNGAVAVAAMLALAACGSAITGTSEDDETFVIHYSTQHTEDTPYSRATAEWADLVKERTDGRVEVELYYSESLLDANQVLPGIADGRAEAGFMVDSMYSNQLPLTSSSSIPFDRQNGVAQALAYHQLYETNEALHSEWEEQGVHVLHFQPPAPTAVGSREPIDGLDDMSGQSMRCLGYVCDAIRAVGANPIAISSAEIYEAMDRGTIDGWTAYPFQDVLASQFQEVTPYISDPGIGAYIQGATPINLEFWNSLPSDLQEILTELSSEYYDIYAEHAEELERETCAAASEAGVELSEFDPEDIEDWRDEVRDPIYDDWAETASEAGVEADAFYDDLMQAYESAEEQTDYRSLYSDCVAGDLKESE